MLPYTHWLRPDRDGQLRRQNEARAADMYQALRRIGRLVRRSGGQAGRALGARKTSSALQPLQADASTRAHQ